MPSRSALPVYVETGRKRAFSTAIEWPGWCRSGRGEGAAIAALLAYGARYEAAIGAAAGGLVLPQTETETETETEIVERLPGNATTDFGVPGASPTVDATPMAERELDRWLAILRALWATFDRTAEKSAGAELKKGPRGGGRELDAIVRHVFEAEGAYVRQAGGRYRAPSDADLSRDPGLRNGMNEVRGALAEAVRARERGDPLPESWRTSKVWTPRYAIRRSAWHVLDHAWEIEDRAPR